MGHSERSGGFLSILFRFKIQLYLWYIGCVFQSNAAVIRISHISAQSSLTSELELLLVVCNVKMHGMQYTSHALKLID